MAQDSAARQTVCLVEQTSQEFLRTDLALHQNINLARIIKLQGKPKGGRVVFRVPQIHSCQAKGVSLLGRPNVTFVADKSCGDESIVMSQCGCPQRVFVFRADHCQPWRGGQSLRCIIKICERGPHVSRYRIGEWLFGRYERSELSRSLKVP
jgi:hypothetical protein